MFSRYYMICGAFQRVDCDQDEHRIEPEDLNIEKILARLTGDDSEEAFPEFSELTYRNVPQPCGEVYRRCF